MPPLKLRLPVKSTLALVGPLANVPLLVLVMLFVIVVLSVRAKTSVVLSLTLTLPVPKVPAVDVLR